MLRTRILSLLALILFGACFLASPAQAKVLGHAGRTNECRIAYQKLEHISDRKAKHLPLGTVVTISEHSFTLDRKPLSTIWGACAALDNEEHAPAARIAAPALKPLPALVAKKTSLKTDRSFLQRVSARIHAFLWHRIPLWWMLVAILLIAMLFCGLGFWLYSGLRPLHPRRTRDPPPAMFDDSP